MFHALYPAKKRDKNLRTAQRFRRLKENDFLCVRFDVVPQNRPGESEGTRRPRPELNSYSCGESVAGPATTSVRVDRCRLFQARAGGTRGDSPANAFATII